MHHRKYLLPALIGAGLSSFALGQDSVSKHQGLPGDAVSAHSTVEQVNDFVVDQAAFQSSWDNTYAIAPLIKSSANLDIAPVFFGHLISAQAISNTSLRGVPFARSTYSVWSGTGFGINNDTNANNPGTPINTSQAVGSQFGVAFAEFGGNNENIIAGVVNYTDDRPSRLYVSRINAAVNAPDDTCGQGSFGFGGVDSDGNLTFRADDFGTVACSGQSPVQGNNLYRIDTLARNASIQNLIGGPGGADAGATAHLVNNSSTTHVCPTLIPESVAGRPILVASDFNGQYVFEQVAGSTTSTGAQLAGAATGTRGTVSYSRYNFPPIFTGSTNGTMAILALDGGGNSTILNLWGLGPNGTVAGTPLAATLPGSLTDNHDSSNFSGSLQFDHYHSQIPFTGGNGMVAIGRDQAGRILIAAEVDHPQDTGPDHGDNLIAVGRIASGGVVTWTVAGHNTGSTGKAIYDGGGNVIGNQVSLLTVTSGGALPLNGPSCSSPMIDSVGNVFFLSGVQVGQDVGIGLLKAVYNPGSFSYQLELVFMTGDVFRGQNSNTDYQLRFISIADSNSISSQTAFSGNINQDAYNGMDPAQLATDDSRTLGGMVINCQIVYDVNQDGMFVQSTGQNGDPQSPDEDYAVALYITGSVDCNMNGIPDDADIASGAGQDSNGNGQLDECEFGPGTPFCFGDGTGVGCPCGNNSPTSGEGCVHSGGVGMLIGASGSTSISNDDLTMTATQAPLNNSGIFYVGTIPLAGNPLYDGIQCPSGNVRRFQGLFQSNGTTSDTNFVAQDPSGVYFQPGGTYHFQYWTRDVFAGPSPCATQANFSPALTVTMTP